MKTFQLVMLVILLVLTAGCPKDSTSPSAPADAPVLHECVFTYDIDGEERTFTSYAEACPDHPDWQDKGPGRDSISHTNATGLSSLSTTTTTKTTDHKCVYTYYILGEKHTYTVCAPVCPDHPDWRDLGTPCP